MVTFFIDNPPNMVFIFDWQVISIIPYLEDFSHRLTFFEPRDYRVVFEIQEKEFRSESELFLDIGQTSL